MMVDSFDLTPFLNLPWYVPDDSDEENRNDIDGAEIGDISTKSINP